MKRRDQPLLKIKDLVIKRGDNFCLYVDELVYDKGQIICLAGANGSGKTTLVECLVSLLVPDQGYVLIGDKVVRPENMAIKKEIGFVPDDDGWIVAELTAQEYFNLLIKIYKKSGVSTDMQARVAYLAEAVLFTDWSLLLGELSHGNKKKVQLIAALLHQPSLVVVDEVRNGLDPIVIKRVEKLLQREARRGATIIAATHDLWWAERFSQSVVFLQAGQIVLADKKRRILNNFGSLEAGFESIFGTGSKARHTVGTKA